MSAIANLILNNGLATPAPVTFVPVVGYQGKNQGAVWQSTAGRIAPIDYPRVELNMKRTANRSTHLDFKISVPYVINDPVKGPVLICTAMFSQSSGYVIPDNCPASVTADLVAFVKNFTAHAVVTAAVTAFEMPR